MYGGKHKLGNVILVHANSHTIHVQKIKTILQITSKYVIKKNFKQ